MLHPVNLAITLTILVSCAPLLSVQAADNSAILDLKGNGVKRYEANQTQIGFASTRVFYTVASHNTVVVVHVDNTDKKFAASCKAFVFGKGVTADDLAKWVNNQHSDALFADIPEPVVTHTLAAEAIKTVSSKLVGIDKGGPRGDIYERYVVEFDASEAKLNGNLTLASFKDAATVYTKPSAVMKTSTLDALKGRKLLVGSPTNDGVRWEGDENVGAFKYGAMKLALNYPRTNFDKGVRDVLAVVEVEYPVTNEQLNAYEDFSSLHPAKTSPVLIFEVPTEEPKASKTQQVIKARLLGIGHYPTGQRQDFSDDELGKQQIVLFGKKVNN
jgi:hypothetical protein